MKMKDFIKKYPQKICNALEYMVAAIVCVAIVVGIITLIPNLASYLIHSTETESLMLFLERVFNVVIGIEFLKVLCKPNSDNIIETLIFLVARHMIIGSTTPFEDFISVISVAILCVLRRYLHITKVQEGMVTNKNDEE